MIAVSDRPRVGVSACLLGERVRYDGRDKRHAWLVDVLGPRVEWVPVCPEVEAGFGTPREPMNLARTRDHRLVLVTSTASPGDGSAVAGEPREDLTAALARTSADRVETLASNGLDGYVLKAGSPSCGLAIPIEAFRYEHAAPPARSQSLHDAGVTRPVAIERGPGMFAAALLARLPGLPIVEERQLDDEAARQRFADDVFAHRALRTRR
jgi:uncharacterized protein YbbK (DUF523 family)